MEQEFQYSIKVLNDRINEQVKCYNHITSNMATSKEREQALHATTAKINNLKSAINILLIE